jgi:hypothetical protein
MRGRVNGEVRVPIESEAQQTYSNYLMGLMLRHTSSVHLAFSVHRTLILKVVTLVLEKRSDDVREEKDSR